MPRSTWPTILSPGELAQAVANLTQYLLQTGARFSISGGAACTLIRMQYGDQLRSTENIDLVVQPSDGVTAETISFYLLQSHSEAFVEKVLYGVPIPAMLFRRTDGSLKQIDIEIFDVLAWPQRQQYNLDNSDNEVTTVSVSGVGIPVFGPRWLLKEKIVTAYERQGSMKERTDLEDIAALLNIVESNCLDLTGYENAVQHALTRLPNNIRQLLEFKVICPGVFGSSWTWNESAEVFWRLNTDNELRYIDADFKRHKFKWDQATQVWYFTVKNQQWFYSTELGDICRFTSYC